MIKYALQCSDGHRFEGWFGNMADYDHQHESGMLECPVCGASSVEKALMAPSVATSRKREATDAKLEAYKSALNETARRARDYVEKNFDHVGKNFPEEARKIHYGEAPDRAIYGDATPKEAKELADEGVSIAPVPTPEPAAEPVAADPKTKLN